MVRRSTVDRSPQSGAYGAGYEAEAEHLESGQAARARASRARASGAWGGAGGRWLVCPSRAAWWPVLLFVASRGVPAFALGKPPQTRAGGGAPASPASRFP